MKQAVIKSAAIAALVLLCGRAQADWWGFEEEELPYKKVALIVQNHCPGDLDLPMQSFADVIAAKLSEQGLRVINVHNAIGVKQNTLPRAEIMPESSAKELARMLGADGLVTASILSLSGETIGLPDPVAYRVKAKIAINLADAATGATVCGVVEPNAGKNFTVEQSKEDGDLLFESVLLSAADKCANKFLAKYRTVEWTVEQGKYVKVNFAGNIKGALIKVDGVAVGTIPATGKIPEGVHNLTIEYPFCISYHTMATFADGQTYNAELQLNAEGISRYNNMVRFNEEIDRMRKSGETDDYVRRKMADGESEALKIKAKSEAAADESGAMQAVKNLFMK